MATVYIVQGWYDKQHGWEDLTASNDKVEAYDLLKDYDLNEPEYGHRILKRVSGDHNV